MATAIGSIPKLTGRPDHRTVELHGVPPFTFTMPGYGLIRRQAICRGLTCC